jgi:hypothetical protein
MNRLRDSIINTCISLSLITGIPIIGPNAAYGQHQGHQASSDPTDYAGTVSITVDGTIRYQTFEGFGATLTAFEKDGEYRRHDHNQPERVTATQADRLGIARMIYTQLGIRRTRVALEGFEPENDNDDPFTLNPAGFDWSLADAEINFIRIARPFGLQTWWASFEAPVGARHGLRAVRDGESRGVTVPSIPP